MAIGSVLSTPAAGQITPAAGQTTPAAGQIKLKQSRLKGLLVRPLQIGGFAGIASQMSATATPVGEADARVDVRFNQDVGEMMGSALEEVIKFLYVRHDKIPTGYRIDIAFEDHYTPKDGSSAAIACALMIDSLITGAKIDPRLAVTGDMNADGSVRPVGGVPAKVRGARAKDCQLVAVPLDNARSLVDLVITEGVAPITRIQVFTIKDFAEAKALADLEKSANIARAIAEFAMVQAAVARHEEKVLANPKVRGKLRAILALSPNHLSAKILLDKALGRFPETLSLQGSLESIERSAASLIDAAAAGRAGRSVLAADDLADAIGGLRRVRPQLDRRTWGFADAIQDFGKRVRELQAAPLRGVPRNKKKLSEIQNAARLIEAEASKIRNNEAMMEELMGGG